MRVVLVLLTAFLIIPHGKVSAQTPTQASAPTILGEWRGTLSPAPGRAIPLVLHVSGATGHWAATLDSPTQGAIGLPVSSVTQEAAEVRFALAAPKADYVATLSADGRLLTGKWL